MTTHCHPLAVVVIDCPWSSAAVSKGHWSRWLGVGFKNVKLDISLGGEEDFKSEANVSCKL